MSKTNSQKEARRTWGKDEEKMDSKAQRKAPFAKFWAVNVSI